MQDKGGHKEPLISVIVITYNSANYVEETLNSIKAQTYCNIELIVTDDYSTDDTVSICEKWLNANKSRFKKTEFITTSKNTGIASNLNRGVKASTGKWLKLIAGDDLLMRCCVEDYIEFSKREDASFIFGLPEVIGENNDKEANRRIERRFSSMGYFYKLPAQQQFLHLLTRGYPMSAPTIFIKRKTLIMIGCFDENLVFEDFPLYLKATYLGYKLVLLKKKTIIYRVHNQSITHQKNGEVAISFWKRKEIKHILDTYVSWPLIISHPAVVWDIYNRFLTNEVVVFLGNSKKVGRIGRIFRVLSPIYLQYKIGKLKEAYAKVLEQI